MRCPIRTIGRVHVLGKRSKVMRAQIASPMLLWVGQEDVIRLRVEPRLLRQANHLLLACCGDVDVVGWRWHSLQRVGSGAGGQRTSRDGLLLAIQRSHSTALQRLQLLVGLPLEILSRTRGAILLAIELRHVVDGVLHLGLITLRLGSSELGAYDSVV